MPDIPKRMRGLERDARGLPIPATVWRDAAGRPHFTINDFAIAGRLLIEDRCGICGGGLLQVRWFVGGPLSAFHPQGAYYDLPMHRGCMHYALRVCPYLAAPVYSKRIDDKTVQGPEKARLFIDPTMIENRPTVFVAVAATGQQLRSSPTPAVAASIVPTRPYVAVEYWRHGEQISEREANHFVVAALRDYREHGQ